MLQNSALHFGGGLFDACLNFDRYLLFALSNSITHPRLQVKIELGKASGLIAFFPSKDIDISAAKRSLCDYWRPSLATIFIATASKTLIDLA